MGSSRVEVNKVTNDSISTVVLYRLFVEQACLPDFERAMALWHFLLGKEHPIRKL